MHAKQLRNRHQALAKPQNKPARKLHTANPALLITLIALISLASVAIPLPGDLARAANLPTVAPQALQIINFGGGNMDWQATPSAPWITLNLTSGVDLGDLLVGIDPSGLTPGVYQGSITITGQAGRVGSSSVGSGFMPALPLSIPTSEQVAIPVTLNLLPTKTLEAYLPLVRR